jgi:hypothetical protein
LLDRVGTLLEEQLGTAAARLDVRVDCPALRGEIAQHLHPLWRKNQRIETT